MNVREFLYLIDKIAPFNLAEDWDNSGLMVGDYKAAVKKIAVVLDPSVEAVKLAAKNNCDVLLCHHPLIFRPVKKIEFNDNTGAIIKQAVINGVNIIAAHTNWDKAGLNVSLAKLLGLEKISAPDPEKPFLIQGALNEKISLKSFLTHIKNSWNLTRLDCYAKNYDAEISRAALCGGSGAEFWRAAKFFNNDIYITADIKYHELIDANNSGLIIAVPEHGEMERASLPELVNLISSVDENHELEIILLDSKALTPPLRF